MADKGEAGVKPKRAVAPVVDEQALRKGRTVIGNLIYDLKTFRWMLEPSSSGTMILVVILTWAIFRAFTPPGSENPLDALLFISYPLSPKDTFDGIQRYAKGPKDLLFLLFYIPVFSFLRQSSVRYVVQPLARKGGIKDGRKMERFTEQGYALMYWGTSSAVGYYVMRQLPTWWYKMEEMWLGYPHWQMLPSVKAYYLLQFAFWLQQLLIMVLRIEAPRSDFTELVAHHIVTLWLIGWSYLLNLTYIGVLIYFSMDIADVFLAASKLINYLSWQRTSEVSFACLIVVWTYFRHYQNLRILYSVWYDHQRLIDDKYKVFEPLNGLGAAPWMNYQIFAPILLLQVLNLFWYFLMWRIVYRMVRGTAASDIREGDEDDEGIEDVKTEAMLVDERKTQ